MAYPSLRAKYRPIEPIPPELQKLFEERKEGTRRGKAWQILDLLKTSPGELTIGTLDQTTGNVQLRVPLHKEKGEEGEPLKTISFKDLEIIFTGFRTCFRRKVSEVGAWLTGPQWNGGSYGKKHVLVKIGLVDMTKPVKRAA